MLASKLAFMGWGIGSATLDFTGFSGHAAMSACIYPPLMVLLGSSLKKLSRGTWASLGLLFAAAIAFSRLPLHAHSVSEVVAGFALGSAASLYTLYNWTPSSRAVLLLRWLAPAALVIATLQSATPNVSTHDMVQRTAKVLSGRDKLYTRKWLHQRSEVSTQSVAEVVDNEKNSGQSLEANFSLMD